MILVVVTMDFMTQVQNYMMSQQYDSLLKKPTLRGRWRDSSWPKTMSFKCKGEVVENPPNATFQA